MGTSATLERKNLFHWASDIYLSLSVGKAKDIEREHRDFPGGAVVKNPPANAGDRGSNPGPGRFHMPRSN